MDRIPNTHMEHQITVLPWYEEVPILHGTTADLLGIRNTDRLPLFETAVKFFLAEHNGASERFIPHMVRLDSLSPGKLVERLSSIGFAPAPLRHYLSFNRRVQSRNDSLEDRSLCYVGEFVQPFEGNSWWQTFLFFKDRNEYYQQLAGIYDHPSYFLGPSKGEYDGDRYAIVMPLA